MKIEPGSKLLFIGDSINTGLAVKNPPASGTRNRLLN